MAMAFLDILVQKMIDKISQKIGIPPLVGFWWWLFIHKLEKLRLKGDGIEMQRRLFLKYVVIVKQKMARAALSGNWSQQQCWTRLVTKQNMWYLFAKKNSLHLFKLL